MAWMGAEREAAEDIVLAIALHRSSWDGTRHRRAIYHTEEWVLGRVDEDTVPWLIYDVLGGRADPDAFAAFAAEACGSDPGAMARWAWARHRDRLLPVIEAAWRMGNWPRSSEEEAALWQ